MTPTEVEQIASAIKEADNSNTMYVIVSILIVLLPTLLWAGRIIFKKTISQVVEDSVQPQFNLVKELVDVRHQENKQLFDVMEMHIDELRHIKLEQNEIKERVSHLEKGSSRK